MEITDCCSVEHIREDFFFQQEFKRLCLRHVFKAHALKYLLRLGRKENGNHTLGQTWIGNIIKV